MQTSNKFPSLAFLSLLLFFFGLLGQPGLSQRECAEDRIFGPMLPGLSAQDRPNASSSLRSSAQNEDTRAAQLNDYLERIETAQQLRNYNLAIKLLMEARQKFPAEARLWLLSGELYAQQNLLRLSLESYQQALALEPRNTRFIYRVANLQDRLGRYNEAVSSYRMLAQHGNSIERNQARFKSAWLLYKLHRYPEAEANILAIPPEERSSSDMMTLAIIYSAAYNYDESLKAYEQSLALTYPDASSPEAVAQLRSLENSIKQRALIYYNYALLENDFRHFDRAMDLNNKSIEILPFASNELLRGELYLKRRQFRRAREAFLRSQRLEELNSIPSPLALLDLVQFSIDQGTPREGMVFFRELNTRFRKQTEWMTSYGIDPVNFELELMKLRSALYKGLRQEQRWLLPLNLAEHLSRYWNLLRYQWLYWYSSIQEKLLSYQVGREHYQQGNKLDSSQKLFNASDPGSRLRRRFFHRLKAEHLDLIPESKGVLLLEEAMEQQDLLGLEQSLKLLSPKWDAEERERAYIELSKLRRTPQLSYADLLQAYESNPASLKNNGIALPLQLQISGSAAYRPEQQGIERQLRGYLGRSGARVATEAALPLLQLQIQWSDTQIKAYLLSPKGTVLRSVESSKLEEIREARSSGSLSARQQRLLLKQFSQDFMQQAFFPLR